MPIGTADAAETIRLWPEGEAPPSPIEGVPDEVEYPVTAGLAAGGTFVRNISDPTLTVFPPPAGPRLGFRPDAIGMIGFSAGAFLAVDVALDPRAEQVAFIAPIYGGETQGAAVPDDAPPLFIAVAQDDILVKIVEGLHADWAAADRPAELHSFARGGHGFGMVRQGLPSDRWTDLFLAW